MAATEAEARTRGAGLAYALGAYALWGVFPLYWKELGRIPAIEILAHRILWSFVFVAILVAWQGRAGEVVAALRSRRTAVPLLGSTALVTSNWFMYIWAVEHGRVTETSLGYYVNPLFNVLLGRVFLGERLRPVPIAAVAIAGAGVGYLALGIGAVPWIAGGLATTFGFYGLLRKRTPVEPLVGLTVEVALAAPFALGFIAWLAWKGTGAIPTATGRELALLVGAGAATALPLLLFGMAAKRLRYATLGIVQYLSPTVQLVIAVTAFGEPFTRSHAITFALIWTAVLLYAADGLRAAARPAPVQAPAPAPEA